IGHNHPAIIAALKEELDRSGPAMLQSHVPQLAAQLAQRLVQLAGGKLRRVFFTSSGSEGVETAIKFSRAHTRRGGLLSVGAVLMSEAVSDSVFSSLKRAIVHASTFGENALSMRAGLATLDVLEQEGLSERGSSMGARLRQQ